MTRALAAAALLAACVPGAAAAHADPQIIRVEITDRACSVRPRQVGFGNTHFLVTNRGRLRHGFAFAGRGTGWLAPGGRAVIDVDFLEPGGYGYFCTTPRRSAWQGRFRITTVPGASEASGVALTEVASMFMPVVVAAPPGDRDRVVVAQLDGLVHLLVGGKPRERPFLDLREDVQMEGEKGLLGLAFAPDYAQSGLLYLFYNDTAGNLRLAEVRRGAADPDTLDPATLRQLLRIEKFAPHHNGGMLQFGADGYLYVNVGDGGDGPGHPVGSTGQTLDDLFGSILRIDPRAQAGGAPYGIPPDNPFVGRAGVRPEIWAYGLRNPWRSWIDAATGAMYVADVGADTREEVDLLPAGAAGANLGWPCREGTAVHDRGYALSCADRVDPIHEYGHEDGACSITGGVVVHDPRLPELDGYYLFSDLCHGRISKLYYENGFALVRDLGLVVPAPLTFGVDGQGRVYAGSATGRVYRLDPRAP